MENGNSPATKQDIERLDRRLDGLDRRLDGLEQRLDGLEQRFERLEHRLEQGFEQLRSEMNHMYNDLVERMADRETRLLNAFYGFIESNQKRLNEIESNEAALRSRIGTIESRLIEVEKRLNIPPAA